MSDLPLFTYGTLMSGERQSPLLSGLRRIDARVKGRLFELNAGYPVMVLEGQSWVYGELVEAPGERRLAILDLYEGVDEGLYRRVRVTVSHHLRFTPAWAYVMEQAPKTGCRPIPSGQWRRTRMR